MTGINKVILIGNIGRIETKQLSSGGVVANITLATSSKYKDKNSGQEVETTEWHNIVAFGRLAEIMAQYLQKGSKIYIEGSLKTETYEKDGSKRYATKIIAKELQMLDSKGASGQQNQGQQATSSANQYKKTSEEEFDLNDIPF